MKSVATRFLLPVVALAVAFTALDLYQEYSTRQRDMTELLDRQTALALAFDLAIRDYVAEEIRPAIKQRSAPDEFMPETMSTSFVARSIFDKVRQDFPDCIIKFSSDDPRNPANQAGPDELRMIQYFNDHPEIETWSGEIELDGRPHRVRFAARRMEESCLHCHGRPEDAPAALLARYGTTAGFHRPIGEVIALDTAAIPLKKPRAAFMATMRNEAVFMVVGLGVLVILIAGVFRFVVTRRLILMRTHFERIAAQPDAAAWRPAEVRGSDEISALGRSFNTMVDRIRDAHASLEQRVADRTAELRTHSAALAAAANAIVITDRNGCITWVNPAFTDLTGYTSKAAIGQNPRFLKSDKCDDGFYRDLWNTILAGDVWHGELVNRRKDGSLYTEEMTVTPVKDEGGAITHFIAIKQDVSERKRADEQLRKTNAMLEEQTARAGDMAAQAELANAAKSEFLANMSHEIRTPMTAILGNLELTAEGCPRQCEFGRTERAKQSEVVKRNAEHLLRLIDNILDLSKLEAGKLEVEQVSCSVVELVSDVHSLMRPRADQNNLTLDVEYSGPIPTVIRTDPTRLKQILINLVGNALKFTETGSVRLVVSLLRETASGPQMRFDVIDSGIGLTAEQIDLIFEAFMQADTSTTRKFGGTGLGLRISKQLTELLGGTITVESKPGQGSLFRVTVATGSLAGVKMLDAPATAAITQPEKTTAAKIDLAKLDCRILLAEDGPDNQRLIAHVLKKAGAEVAVVENGKLAVDAALAARQEGNSFDVILMDMQMPVMDGYEATGLLRQKGYVGPIIALTAHTMAGDRQKCLDAGCDDYASKPIERTKLITAIQEWRKKGSICGKQRSSLAAKDETSGMVVP